MKKLRSVKALGIILMCFLTIQFTVFGYAGEEEFLNEAQQGELHELFDYINGISGEYELIKDMDMQTYLDTMLNTGNSPLDYSDALSYGVRYMFRELTYSIQLVASLIVIALVCALLNKLQEAFSNGEISKIAYFTCYALMIMLMANTFYIGVDVALDAIAGLTNLMMALVPVLLMLLASVGGFTQAAVMDPVILGVVNIGANIIKNVIIPLIIMSFVLSFVNNLSDDYKVENLSKLIKQVALTVQGLMMTIFITIITMRGITTKAFDEVTMKTAKFAVDNFVPVVGGAFSDAVSSIAGYSLLLKSAIGSVGLIVILAIAVAPIIKLGVMGFVHKLVAAMIEPVSDKKIVSCITSVGNALILIMSCVLTVSIMCFIMVAIIAGTGSGILYM